ncbi:MAG: glycosyltransferase family 2 protein [Candidatus Electrothrix sp. LOE2]|nr:glycosyltransferase family 2 protein [Candidatus Electrothrix sp. LOE2]
MELSIIIPCYNEEGAVATTLKEIQAKVNLDALSRIICIDDGSTDNTRMEIEKVAARNSAVKLVCHATNRGYGASLKTGIRHAQSELVIIIDADGTYPIDNIKDLLKYAETADMVVGARTGTDVIYSRLRRIPKIFLKHYASWLSNYPIPDINSGLRIFRRSKALQFVKILPDGFSFTTTITLAMLINGDTVKYVPIGYRPRIGQSKIRPIRDTINFIQLIVRTGVYFAPLRVFMPLVTLLSAVFLASLTYDIFWLDDITDKTLIFMFASMNTLIFALLADMIDKRSP